MIREPAPAGGSGLLEAAASCGTCGVALDALRARRVAIVDGRVVAFCDQACRDARRTAAPGEPSPERRRPAWRQPVPFAALLVAGGMLLGVRVSFDERTATAALPASSVAPAAADPLPAAKAEYGPEPPPADFFVEGDRWVHPLGGPVRRLPERPTRRFGAERDHDSPESCREGHCGVDVGEVLGEPVLAVHDGVVERIVKEDGGGRSGRYLRLLHHGGRIVTQYMHLDEIEPSLKPGVHVRAGEKIGTVGESGVKNAGPHLHFTVATREGESRPERYLDPEPLLVLWPLVPR